MPEITPIQSSPHLRFGSNSGQPLTRRDGVLKVTGRATYAADNHPDGMLFAVHAVSTIARGRVTHLDVEAARAHPGVVEVITPANRPPLMHDPDEKQGLFGFRLEALQNDRVRYANQPIALVVAETLEAATEGAALLRPRYEVEPARTGLDHDRFVPASVGVGGPNGVGAGDVEAGLAKASKRIDATYETPAQYHNAMEPHALVAAWDGDRLTLDTPNQAPVMSLARLRELFRHPARERPDPHALHRRRVRIEGDSRRPADPLHPGGAYAGPAGEAGLHPRPDVRPRRPSRRDTPAPAPRHGAATAG